ncbi:hypothetical protein [Streptomyces xanthochromogenes]|uniref:hypothetical protein n=1 Tax=Streptomyces xanthochromogenes TaxID=67384 RepID=UPI003442B03F
MHIPGPELRTDGGAGAIAAAGGLHHYQRLLHAAYGPVVRFQLPGAETAVSISDPVLLEATAHLDERPERLFDSSASGSGRCQGTRSSRSSGSCCGRRTTSA